MKSNSQTNIDICDQTHIISHNIILKEQNFI